MSGKLDQSLDEILSTQKSVRGGRGPRRGRRAPQAGRATAVVAAPVGGVKKNAKQAKGAVKAIPTGPAGGNGESKIQVSNLPKDVDEAQIKEYFNKSIGPVKRAEISYGPGGSSRGIATITFSRADSATKAVNQLNGVLVDLKPMRIEVILDARRAAALPPPKGLSERIAQPKAQPKSAVPTKAAGAGTRGKTTRGRGRGGRSSRPTKKTAEELDSEMADYWETGANANGADAGTTAPPAANGDAAMDDEIL